MDVLGGRPKASLRVFRKRMLRFSISLFFKPRKGVHAVREAVREAADDEYMHEAERVVCLEAVSSVGHSLHQVHDLRDGLLKFLDC